MSSYSCFWRSWKGNIWEEGCKEGGKGEEKWREGKGRKRTKGGSKDDEFKGRGREERKEENQGGSMKRKGRAGREGREGGRKGGIEPERERERES